MGRRELITIAVAVVTSASALFGAMQYVESRFVNKDELSAYMSQVLTRLQSIEEALRSR